MQQAPFAVEVSDLCKVYRPNSPSPVVALDRLSLRVERGEIFGLLGPNGAGKTTLIKILSTLSRQSSGQALVNGYDVSTHPLETRQSLAVVLQTSAADMYLSVWDNLLSYGLFHRLSRAETRRRAGRVIDMFGLGDYVDEKCQDLSGGYKRRVQVAKSFLIHTPILFLDEATTGMDPVIRRRVLEYIREQAARGRTIFLATQILNEAEELCDRIAIIDEGRLKALGDLHTLKAMVRQVYEATLTFEEVNGELIEFFERQKPLRLKRQGNTIVAAIQASEARVMEVLGEATRRWPALYVEVSGASLEDVFLATLKRKQEEVRS